MRRKLSSLFFTIIFGASQGMNTHAQKTPAEEMLKQKSYSIGEKKDFTRGPAAKERQETFMLLESRERNQVPGTQGAFGLQTDLAVGQERASAMIKIIQDAEMKKALEKITSKGQETLEKNPEIRTPIGILAGAVSLWAGRTVQLFKSSDVRLSSYFEGKSRSGNFNIDSPLVNGRLKFDQVSGLNVGVNRSISSFNTSAGIQYNVKSQTMSTQLYQRVAPHLGISLDAGQSALNNSTEGAARVMYELQF